MFRLEDMCQVTMSASEEMSELCLCMPTEEYYWEADLGHGSELRFGDYYSKNFAAKSVDLSFLTRSICLDMFEILGLEFGIAFFACHIMSPSCRGWRVEALLQIPKCQLSWCQELSSLGSLEIPSQQRFRRVLVSIGLPIGII